jgi:hypothetical protein
VSGIISNNPQAKLYSLEANKEMYMQAYQYYDNKIEQLELIYGTLHKNLVSLDYIEKHPTLLKLLVHGEAYKTWYNKDMEDMKNTECYIISEKTIDVVILDGGEFSSIPDWEVLKEKNPKVVCLDDTNVFKNYDLRNSLLESSEWELLADDLHDRNGWCAFKRKTI